MGRLCSVWRSRCSIRFHSAPTIAYRRKAISMPRTSATSPIYRVILWISDSFLGVKSHLRASHTLKTTTRFTILHISNKHLLEVAEVLLSVPVTFRPSPLRLVNFQPWLPLFKPCYFNSSNLDKFHPGMGSLRLSLRDSFIIS